MNSSMRGLACVVAVISMGAGLFLVTENAGAGTVTFSGTLSSTDPTCDRAGAYTNGSQSNTFLSYSGIGNNTFYEVQSFTVDRSDNYTFTAATQVGPTSSLVMLTIYQAPFNPSNAATNYLSDAFSNGGITYSLTPKRFYEIVVAAQYNGDRGNYSVTISAPNGDISLGASSVPEPSALTLLGFGAAGLLTCGGRRRKRTKGANPIPGFFA